MAAFLAVLAVGVVELIGGLPGAADQPIQFAAICLAVTTVAASVIGLIVSITFLLPRVVLALLAGCSAAAQWPGVFATTHSPLAPDKEGVWIHGVGVGLSVFVFGVTITINGVFANFTHLALASLVCAVASIFWICTASLLAFVTVALLRAGSHRLAGERPLPYSGPVPAILIWLALCWVFALVATTRWQAFSLVFPYRLAASGTVFVLVLLLAYMRAARLFELARRRIYISGSMALVLAVITVGTLGWFGGNDDVRRMALRSPTLTILIDIVRSTSDWDRDGYTSLLNGGDCRPFDAGFHPGARDIPKDGLDQNCRGGDYVRPIPTAKSPPVDPGHGDRSILLVTIDTLRYDHVGFAGYERVTTPRLDSLASRGAFFLNAYSPGNRTYFVIPSLVSSLPHERLPLGERSGPGLPLELKDEVTTLAEVMESAGYRTGLFTSHAYFEGWGVEQGFQQVVNLPEVVRSKPAAHRLVERTLGWLEDTPENTPWFAWVHFFEPHYPYEPHGYNYGNKPIDHYDEEIRYVDTQLARLVDWVESDPTRRDNTIIVVTSDHGEALGEYGQIRHGGDGLQQVLLHIPLIIAVPGVDHQMVRTPVSLVDLAPTIVDLAGPSTQPDPVWTGRSYISEILDGTNDEEVVVFSTDPNTRNHAAVTTNWKLTCDERHNVYQLINLNSDPAERYDASVSHPEVRARLETAMNDWRERTLD